MSNDKAQPAAGIILTVLSVFLVVGVLTFAGPCEAWGGELDDCVGASRAVFAVGGAAFVLSVVRIFERDEGERRGLDLGVALMGALVALMPGVVLGLCADQTLRCHTVMQPFCVVAGCALALVAAGDLTVRLLRLRKA